MAEGQPPTRANNDSDIRISRKPLAGACDYCGKEFEDGEEAYRLARGKVHSFSVPSFVPDTASIFYHLECWDKIAVKNHRKNGVRERVMTTH